MKKVIIIILAVVLFLVGAIWLYLLLFGAPESAEDFFADLGFSENPVVVEPITQPITENPIVDQPLINTTDPKALQQLTTRPVAGAIIIGTSTDNYVVRYVEQGVGHIFEINLSTGVENRISSKTHTRITDAIWSSDSRWVVFVADGTTNRSVTLYDTSVLGEGTASSLQPIELAPDIQNISFSEKDDTLYYTRSDAEGTLGYIYDVATNESLVGFSVPFRSVSILWGSGDQPVVYNRPSELHPGYAYKISDTNNLQPLTSGGIGLTAFRTNNTVVVNRLSGQLYKGGIVRTDATDTPTAIPLLPEKCAPAETENTAWCAYPLDAFRGLMPNDWYKGKISLTDALWRVDLTTGTASLVENITQTTGQELDIVTVTTNSTKKWFTFKDKKTNYLWRYDPTL